MLNGISFNQKINRRFFLAYLVRLFKAASSLSVGLMAACATSKKPNNGKINPTNPVNDILAKIDKPENSALSLSEIQVKEKINIHTFKAQVKLFVKDFAHAMDKKLEKKEIEKLEKEAFYWGKLILENKGFDLTPPAAPTGLRILERPALIRIPP